MARKTKHENTGRARRIPIQVYVSEHEHTALLRITQQRDVSVSELVRAWIRRSIAASNARSPAARSAAAQRDPRQAELFEAVQP